MQKLNTDHPHRISVSPTEAARLLGVSRALIYKLINSGQVRRCKVGSRTLILVADLEKLVEGSIE